MNKNKPLILEVALVWCFIAATKKSDYRSLDGFCGYEGLKLKCPEEGFICGDDCHSCVFSLCFWSVFPGLNPEESFKTSKPRHLTKESIYSYLFFSFC